MHLLGEVFKKDGASVASLLAHAFLTIPLSGFPFPLSQNTKHYELLNYSEHGTTVDNVLYSCDFSEKTALTPPSSMVAKVQSVISKF